MARVLLIILLVAMTLTAGTCQTFQYSRGWTNGKRSNENANLGEAGFQSEFKIANFPGQAYREYSPELSTPSLSSSAASTHCSLQKLKMMLRGNGNEELYLLPCDFLDGLRSPYLQQQQQQQQQQRRRLHQ